MSCDCAGYRNSNCGGVRRVWVLNVDCDAVLINDHFTCGAGELSTRYEVLKKANLSKGGDATPPILRDDVL